MGVAIKIPSEFTAIDKVTSVVKKMTSGVSKFAKSGVAAVKRLDNKIDKTFNKLGKFQKLILGLSVGALFTMAIQNNIAFNDSLASVSAITGSTGKDLAILENLANNTARSQKKLGSDVLKAYEVVGSAQPILLENSELLDKVTNSAITLSKASRLDLETSALALTDVMNQFNITGAESDRVINVLANGAKFGAAAIPLIKDSIVVFGTAAKQANVTVEQSVALIETLADKGLKGAQAGTALRNVLSKMSSAKGLPKAALSQLRKFGVDVDIISDKNVDFTTRLKEMAKIAKDPVAMMKVFGAENQIAGGIILNNIGRFEDLSEKMTRNGAAAEAVAANTNTVKFALDSIKIAFLNTTTATNDNNTALEFAKSALTLVAENMDIVVGAGIGLIGAFFALKAITTGAMVVSGAYNIILGIQAAATGTLTKKIVANSFALNAYKTVQFITTKATDLWTGAQWLLNAALTANPIGLIIVAIGALVGLVVWAIAKYDEWGAALLQFMGPIGFIINLFKSFQRHWDSIVQAFKTDGIIGGLKRIGAVILDAVLMPMQQFLGLLSKVPGLGKLVAPAIGMIDKMRAKLDLNTPDTETSDQPPEVLPSIQQSTSTQIINKNNNTNLDINLNDPSGAVDNVTQDGNNDIPINITQTQAAF